MDKSTELDNINEEMKLEKKKSSSTTSILRLCNYMI